MEVTLSLTGDYGVRAMLDVALAYGSERRKARQIAETMRIPKPYLARILAELVAADLLIPTAGRHGGYELTRPPSEIRLIEIVEVLEGTVALERCVVRGIPCSSDGICAMHDAWSAAQDAFATSLRNVSLADIAERDRLLHDESSRVAQAT